jgi:hypothetical protein
MSKPTSVVESFGREFVGAELGDARLSQRLPALARFCVAAPDQSLPDLAPTQADLTAFYRFLRADGVTMRAILEPHQQATARRCIEARKVIVIQDTTEIELKGDKRRGLGPLRGSDARGFLLHPSFAIAGDGSRRPLGVLEAVTWKREERSRSRNADGSPKNGNAYHRETDKESKRWWDSADAVERRLDAAVLGAIDEGLVDASFRLDVIHVGDRETDAYHFVRDATEHGARFVIRMARDRVLLDEDDERLGKTSEVIAACEDILTTEVPIARRASKPMPGSEGARDARVAKLGVTATKRASRDHTTTARPSKGSTSTSCACARSTRPKASSPSPGC